MIKEPVRETSFARSLRRQQTDAEKKLWSLLRNKQLMGYKFRRQFPIPPYIADFACFERKLIVEADGGQHAENRNDHVRTAELERQGWRVLRFWNPEILNNTEGVLEMILAELSAFPSP